MYQLQGSLQGVEGGEGHQGSKVRDGTRHQQLIWSEGEAGHEVTCAEEHRYVCPWIDTDGDKVTVARDENLDIALDEMTVLVREKKKKNTEEWEYSSYRCMNQKSCKIDWVKERGAVQKKLTFLEDMSFKGRGGKTLVR